MKLIVSTVSKVCIRAATLAFTIGIGLLLIGATLASWPFMSKSPNMRKMLVSGEAVSSVLTAIMVFLKTPDA